MASSALIALGPVGNRPLVKNNEHGLSRNSSLTEANRGSNLTKGRLRATYEMH